MPKYTVVVSALFDGGKKYRRGDILETDANYGTRVEPYVEPVVVEPAKPKRKRKTKAEMSADEDQGNV